MNWEVFPTIAAQSVCERERGGGATVRSPGVISIYIYIYMHLLIATLKCSLVLFFIPAILRLIRCAPLPFESRSPTRHFSSKATERTTPSWKREILPEQTLNISFWINPSQNYRRMLIFLLLPCTTQASPSVKKKEKKNRFPKYHSSTPYTQRYSLIQVWGTKTWEASFLHMCTG